MERCRPKSRLNGAAVVRCTVLGRSDRRGNQAAGRGSRRSADEGTRPNRSKCWRGFWKTDRYKPMCGATRWSISITIPDAFFYETTIWNRSLAKNQMRDWIGRFLQQRGLHSARLFIYGDGLGFDSFFLAQAGHQVEYFDLSSDGSQFARQIFRDYGRELHIWYDASEIPLETYDVVVCLDVLEHVPVPSATISFLTSALRPGGVFIVHAPSGTSIRRWVLTCDRTRNTVATGVVCMRRTDYRFATVSCSGTHWCFRRAAWIRKTQSPDLSVFGSGWAVGFCFGGDSGHGHIVKLGE